MEILRVSNIAGPTSAPFNSFTLFRSGVYSDENTTYVAYHPLNKAFSEGLQKNSANVKLSECNGSIPKLISFVVSWVLKNRSNKNKVIHAHQPGVGLVAFLSVGLLPFFKVPLVYTVHNSFSNFIGIKKIAVLICLLLADKITFVSKDAFKSFKPNLPKRVLRKCIVIQNGADIDRIRRATVSCKQRQVSKTIVLSCVGRLAPQKNLPFLLKVAANTNKDFKLNIYGEGSDRDVLSEQIKQLGLTKKVFLRGNIAKEDLFIELHDSDIYVSAANYEGLAMGLIEALALDVPCLASNISSHKEVKELVPSLELVENDVDKWVASLTKKIETLELEKLSNRKKVTSIDVENHFSMSRMQREYTELYSNLLIRTDR